MNIQTFRAFLLVLGMVAAGAPGQSQIVHTSAFTTLLEQSGIQYAEGLEEYLHVTFPPEHDFMSYQLVLQNDRNDFEIRYRIRKEDKNVPPSVQIAGLVASLASNEEGTEIRVIIPTDALLEEAFHAERGIVAYFTPKLDFSEKDHAAVISLYRTGHPAIDIVLLYYDATYDPLEEYRSMRFEE